MERQDRLRELGARVGAGAVSLRRPYNFAWYTGGADNRVDHAADAGVAEVVVGAAAETVVTTNIEAGRMRAEQTPGLEVSAFAWHEGGAPLLTELAGGKALASDLPGDGEIDVSAELDELRRALDDRAVAQLRDAGRDASAALDAAVAQLDPAMTELDATAAVLAESRRRGLVAPVVLAAGEQRLPLHRHPLPTATRLGGRVMLVLCAERHGLYANLTTFVHFDEPDPELRRRIEACGEILSRMREEATRPGRTLGDAFDECRGFYADAGFPDGWRDHHQGGVTGYRAREIVATPGEAWAMTPGQAFAWNPSLPGAKAEETFLLTADGREVVAPSPTAAP